MFELSLIMERQRISRYTNNDQLKKFSGDVGLEFVQQLVEKELFWGVEND
jgi:hypothetical protein